MYSPIRAVCATLFLFLLTTYPTDTFGEGNSSKLSSAAENEVITSQSDLSGSLEEDFPAIENLILEEVLRGTPPKTTGERNIHEIVQDICYAAAAMACVYYCKHVQTEHEPSTCMNGHWFPFTPKGCLERADNYCGDLADDLAGL